MLRIIDYAANMFYPLSFFIASRYSRSKQANSFISFITFFSVAGITLGVMALITVISVMNGFEGELKKRILGVVPHVLVSQTNDLNSASSQTTSLLTQQLLKQPHVLAVTPFIQSQGMMQSLADIRAVNIQGVAPSLASQHALVAKSMIRGQFDDLKAGQYKVILGRQLAMKMGVDMGDIVRLMLAERVTYTPMGRMPVQRQFTVAGIYDSGSEVDGHVVVVHITDLSRLLRLKKAEQTHFRIYLDDAFASDKLMNFLTMHFTDWQATDWRASQGKLFSAVKMEKNMMWMMLCLIIAVAAFNIVSALVMVVTDKQGEIATLKTLGFSSLQVQIVFLLQGLYKGLLGAVLGTILGVLLALNLNSILSALGIGVFATPGYSLNGLPIEVHAYQVLFIASAAIVMSLLATLYPAYRAAHTKPAVVLRYE